jgi:hypothetical protein
MVYQIVNNMKTKDDFKSIDHRMLYDIKDLTEVIPFSESKIREMVAEGILPMWKIGGKWVISDIKLRKWVDQSECPEI